MNRRTVLKAFGALALAAGALGGWRQATNPYYTGPVTDHFDGTRFYVPDHPFNSTPLDLLRWQLGGGREPWPASFASPFQDKPPARVEGLRVTLVGHASVLIQAGGKNLLVDPVWSDRTSPFDFAGPKRVNPPGIAFDDLPPIDAVLVSHNHYDHLDVTTLARLQAAHRPRFIAPLGNGGLIANGDTAVSVSEQDWGGTVAVGPLTVHLEPIYHWSARGMFDRLKALWCAFVIETPAGKVYHVADTGFRDGAIFAAMRAKHGGFRLAVLPIGAYEPRWFMKNQHVNPEEAVAIFAACGADEAIGHHWGTFQLTNEGIERPPAALAEALAKAAIPAERFRAFRPGEVWQAA